MYVNFFPPKILATNNRDHFKIMYVIHECSYFFFLNIQNMNYILLNHCWMYDRCYSGRSCLKESFVKGVEEGYECYKRGGAV